MSKSSFKFLLILTVLGGITAVIIWRAYRHTPRVTEQPPCKSCADVYSSASGALETVTLSDLITDPGRFNQRLVRIRAVLHNDAGYKDLIDPSTKQTFISTEFTDSTTYGACAGAKEALRVLAGVGNWYDGSAEVIVVGRLGKFDNPQAFREGQSGFVIMCVENVFTE